MQKIIHIDMDAFYASIEQRDHPSLKGRPVVVGHPRLARGVVAAASYEARRYGVRSAMPMVKAWRLCPELCVVPPQFSKYKKASKHLRQILHEYTDLVEPLALDECYLDVTRDKKQIGSATWVAEELRHRIAKELRLTASAGVAPLKFVAKLASDHHKPDGLCVVRPEHVLGFIEMLPVERLWGVGPATAQKLHLMGLRKVRDIAQCDPVELGRQLGRRGRQLYDFSQGRDSREVVVERPHKSRGMERTFIHGLTTFGEVLEIVLSQAEQLCADLQRQEMRARCVTIKVRYEDFTTITRSHSLHSPFAHALTLTPHLETLLGRTQAGQRAVRLVGVSVSGFKDPDRELRQLEMFEP